MNRRPNILLFLPDAVQAAAVAPNHPCITPHMDRIAASGIRFSRAYTPLCTCSPARASLMTGLLPHNHGVLQVEHCVDDDQSVLRLDKEHWAQRLAAEGYRTGYFGKWHIERSNSLDTFGWQTDRGWRSEAYAQAVDRLPAADESSLIPDLTGYQEGADGYRPHLHHGVTTLAPEEREVSVPVDLALPYLDEVLGGEAPWACCVSFQEPNESLVCSKETFRQYEPSGIALPENLTDNLSGGPAVYRRYAQAWAGMSRDDWRRAAACYYARITEVDAQLGRLLAHVSQAGELENTVVIVTSDHGRYLGAHGMDGHNYGAFEEIYNIPLLVSGSGIAAGEVTDARVGLHDLCPTILDLADVAGEKATDSYSFAGWLSDPDGQDERFQKGYAEYHGTRFPLAQRIYWDGDWKFVFNGFDYDELYNLADDPGEVHNLIDDPNQVDRIKIMMKGIWERAVATGDKPLATSQYYALQLGVVGPEWQQ